MKPFFTHEILISASVDELIMLRTAISNFAESRYDFEVEEKKAATQLREDLDRILKCFPF